MIGELNYMDNFEYLFVPQPKFCVQTCDHLTAVTTTSGILLLKLHPDLDKAVSGVTQHKLFIKPSAYMLLDHIDIDVASYLFDLSQDSIYMCLLQSNISGNLENMKNKTFCMTKCALSPRQLIGEEGVVAAVTSRGSLDIYVKVSYLSGISKYEHIMNVTALHIEKFKYKWKCVKEIETAVEVNEELLRRLAMHSVTVVGWTHKLKQKIQAHEKKSRMFTTEYCCLIAAHTDGNISFWELTQTPMEEFENAKLCFMHEYQTNMDHISALYWHKSNGNSGLLIIGDKTGKTIMVPIISLVKNYCENGEEILLTDSTDVAVEHIDVEIKNEHLIVHVVQRSHILMFVINKEAEICQRMHYSCSNMNITDFCQTGETIIISTITGAILEIKTSLDNQKLHVEKRQIYVNIDWVKNALFGLSLSKNNALLSFITQDLGYSYKGPIKMRILNFANNESQALSKFMKLDRLYDGLDLLEIMKVRSLQKKYLLANDLPDNLDYDDLTLSDLKKYLCIAKISESVFDQVETITQYNLKQATDINTMIYIQLSIYLLSEIVKELNTNGAVSMYKQEVGHICYTHLRDVVLSGFVKDHNLKKNYVNEIMKVLDDCVDLNVQDDMICKICEHTFVGLSCPMRHADNRCSFTMVQIVSSRLKCPTCERYVAEEAVAFNKELNCVLCDSPLDTILGDVKGLEFKTFCKEDCLSNV